MANEISGKVFSILPSQTGQGQNGNWVKQQFIVETASDRYPKKVCFIAWNDKAEQVSRLKPGDEVKVSFDLESREYNGRWYTDAKAWRIDAAGASEPAPQSSGNSYSMEQPPPADDLPF